MKKIFFLIVFPFIVTQVYSQQWIKYFGGIAQENKSYSVTQTFDGGYISTGLGEWYNADSGILMKHDANGDSIWHHEFYKILMLSVIQTNDSSFCAIGNIDGGSSTAPGIFIVKTEANGTIIFENTIDSLPQSFGWCTPLSFFQKNDGSYVVSGYKKDTIGYDVDGFILHLDSNGEQLNYFTYDNSDRDYIISSDKLLDGSFIFSGQTKENDDYNLWLLKTDNNLDTIWTESYGFLDFDCWAHSVCATQDSGFVIAGTKRDLLTNDKDILIIKFDLNGNEIWSKTYGTINFNEDGISVKQTNDNGFIVSSELYSGEYIWLLKTDSNGDTLWTNKIESYSDSLYDGFAYPGEVSLTNDGGYILTGSMFREAHGESYVLIKTDSVGYVSSIPNFSITNSRRKLINRLDILGRKTNIQFNKPFIEIYDDGTVEKKVIIE